MTIKDGKRVSFAETIFEWRDPFTRPDHLEMYERNTK